jgi:hypothetical protein
MKKFNLGIVLMLLVSVFVLSSCGDDATTEVDPYVGNYTIQKATLTDTVKMNIIINGTDNEMSFPLPPGTDITQMIQGALLNAIPDCSPESSIVELREDNKLFMSCATSDFSLDAGTWSKQNNGTVIILNFNASAIPGSPSGFTLTVNNVKLENNIMYSNTTVPIPKEVLAESVAASGKAILSDNNPDYFMFTFDLEFKKVN